MAGGEVVRAARGGEGVVVVACPPASRPRLAWLGLGLGLGCGCGLALGLWLGLGLGFG